MSGRRLLGCLAATLGLLACDVSSVGLDGQCALDSDCVEPLVCAATRCRPQCREDRDCDDGATCVAYGFPPARACVRPETPAPCGLHSDCPSPSRCVMGVCRAECAEDVDCATGDRCTGDGLCATPVTFTPAPTDAGAPCTDCGSGCVDLATHPAHCGACGAACPAGQACLAGACRPGGDCDADGFCCETGRTPCEGACVDLATDAAHCGACGVACDPGRPCRNRRCAPVNDHCEDALPIDLSLTSVELSYEAGGADVDEGTCGALPGMFYLLDLPERSIVQLAGTYTREIGIMDADVPCGAAFSACYDVSSENCGSASTSVTWVLEAGSYRIVVGSFRVLSGEPRLVLRHFPVGDAPVAPLAPVDGQLAGDTTRGSPPLGACGAGPEVIYYLETCPEFPGGPMRISACGGAAFDTTLELRAPDGLSDVCVDDDDTCAPQSTLEQELFPGANLYLVRVGGKTASDQGPFTLEVSLP